MTAEQREAHLRMMERFPARTHVCIYHDGSVGRNVAAISRAVLDAARCLLQSRKYKPGTICHKLHIGRGTMKRIMKILDEEKRLRRASR